MEFDYRISHRPGDPITYPEEVATVDKILSGDYFPKDILDNARAYFPDYQKDPETLAIIRLLKEAQNKPQTPITVYRGAPSGGVLNTGDWVSLSEKYARQYAYDGIYADSDNSKVYSYKVKACELSFDGDSIYEFGYWGKTIEHELSEEEMDDIELG